MRYYNQTRDDGMAVKIYNETKNTSDSNANTLISCAVGSTDLPDDLPVTPGRLGKFFFAGLSSSKKLNLMRYECMRLQTFDDWPEDACVRVRDVARAGMYHIGPGDRVRCAFCLNVLKMWDAGDVPEAVHRSLFSRCPLVRDSAGSGNKSLLEHDGDSGSLGLQEITQKLQKFKWTP